MKSLNKISKCFFINLDRRKDRLNHIEKNLPFSAERFPAIDANDLNLNDEILKLFSKCLNKLTKAEIACALSHYKLWKQLSLDNSADNYLILEDDVVFKDGFFDFWNQVFSKHIPKNYNLIYLGGCQPWNKPEYHKVLKSYNKYFCNIKKNDFFTKNDHYFHMNAQSYIISKRGANLICQYIDQLGFDLGKSQAQDVFMINFFNSNELFKMPHTIFHLNPLMSYQLHEENDNTEIDKKSDLRHATEKFNDDNEKISVIIPTIWKANDYMIRSLIDLEKVNCVKEIIVIDNEKTKTPNWINAFKKVKVVDSGKRMYFNESVNFGIDLCKNDICCIYNDDITSDTRVFDYIRNNLTKKDGCIFISPKYINNEIKSNGSLKKVDDIKKDGLYHGSGMMMFVRKNSFIKIPEELVHHFGDIFIFKINQKQGRQNYIIEGFPIKTPGSASEDDNVRKVISEDWKNHKKIFNNLIQFLPKKEITFPLLKQISDKQIPKKIHLSWKNKNILNSNYELIKKGPKNLELLNPDWDIEVYDDYDINKLLRDTIGKNNWNLIKDRKITEKTDLWRLIKTYQEGGLYIDIDRYIDIPLSQIINKKTAMFLPTFQDIDFSQDFILTFPKNPIIGKAIANNLNYRLKDESLFFLAVQSYMHSVSEALTGNAVDRGNNPEYFNNIRNRIDSCEHLETFREIGPEYHTLYRNLAGDFNAKIFEKDKADFYNGESVIHWNTDTQAKHIELKNTKKQKIHNIITTNRRYDVCFCCDEDLIRYAINPINAICEKNTDNNIVIHFIYSGKESDLCYIENVLVDKSNVIFKKYIVDSLDISINKTWRSIEHLSSATNLKLQIPKILKDIDKVIYFDIDTIPYVNLGEFDRVKTDVCGIAMRQEIKNGWRTFNGSKGTVTENKNPVDFGDRVIGNSGVMVLDLVELRQKNFTEFCLNEKRENNYNIPLTGGDQDLINIFCKCYFNELPDKLNILVSDQFIGIDGGKFKFKKFIQSTNQGLHLLKNEGEESSDGGVLHFIGKDKPWNSDCLGYKFWSEFNTKSPKIPEKIFQTWKTKDLNDGLTLLSKSFREKNLGYEYFLYDDDDCRKLIEENFEPVVLEVYDRIIPGAFKADLWRYCALYIEGGIFCDMDMICMKSFDSIINDDIEFFAPIDSNSKGAHDLYNAFMGSAPGHPILKRCIDTIVDNVINETWSKNKQPPLDFSACGVLGRCVNNYIGREDFSSFTGQMGVHDSVKVLNYVKEHRYVEDKEGNKYVWSKDGNKKIKMIVRQAEKEHKAEPWILSVAGGKIPYKQKHESIKLQSNFEHDIKKYYSNLDKNFIFEGGENSIENKGQAKRLIELCNKYNCKNIMEIGFNAGHSADLFLSIDQNIKVTSFDIGVHKYVDYGKKFIDNKYPGRHSLILGDSKKTIPDFFQGNSNIKFDLIFIDGDHSEVGAISDLFNCKKLSHSETIVVMDDTRNEEPMASWNINVNKAWQKCISAGIVYQIESEDYNQEGSCARGQSWGKYVFKEAKNTSFNLELKQKEFIKLKDEWQNFKDYDFLKYISNQIPETQTPRDKFTKYNSGNKIAIVSLYTREISDYAIHSENSIRDYCEKQNYTFYVYREKLEENCSANWSKAQAILRHINDHDYIVWMDSDTLIFNDEKKFEDIISKASRKFIFATKDIGDNSMLNSGVLIFKNHDYVKSLIKKWRDFDGDKTSLYASGGDQEILCDILKKSDGFGFNRKIFEMNEFNTDPRLVNEDSFILHFMAYPYELKKIFMSYWQNNFSTESL